MIMILFFPFFSRFLWSWSLITCKINTETQWYVSKFPFKAFWSIDSVSHNYCITFKLMYWVLILIVFMSGWKYDFLVHILYFWSTYVRTTILPWLDEQKRETWLSYHYIINCSCGWAFRFQSKIDVDMFLSMFSMGAVICLDSGSCELGIFMWFAVSIEVNSSWSTYLLT